MEGLKYILNKIYESYGSFIICSIPLLTLLYFLFKSPSKKKLIILDLNKLLVYRSFKHDCKDDISNAELLGEHYTWIRPGAHKFLEYCFEHYDVAVWSSANLKNLNLLIHHLFGTLRTQLVFEWGQDMCDEYPGEVKPIFKKPLSKVVKRTNYYMEEILIIDDSEIKMEGNPSNCFLITKEWIPWEQETETLEDIKNKISR